FKRVLSLSYRYQLSLSDQTLKVSYKIQRGDVPLSMQTDLILVSNTNQPLTESIRSYGIDKNCQITVSKTTFVDYTPAQSAVAVNWQVFEAGILKSTNLKYISLAASNNSTQYDSFGSD